MTGTRAAAQLHNNDAHAFFETPAMRSSPSDADERQRLSWRVDRRELASLHGHCFFAPKSQHLLHRAIGIAEQHGVVAGAVPYRRPRGDDEDIPRAPLERRVTDDTAPAALDDGEHRSVRRAVRSAG